MKKLAIGGAVAVSLLGGSIAVAALTPIGAAFAGNGAQPVAVQAGQDPPAGQTNGAKGPGGRLQQSLDDLVKDGTLTQDQANKVLQKLQGSLGRGGPRRPGGFGGEFLRPGLDAVAKSIGVSTDDLKTELKTGKSIAEVATAHGVRPQQVITDLTTAATAKIDEAVASGKLTADMAAKIKAHLPAAITQLVNGKFNGAFPGHGRPGGPGGPQGPNAPNGPDASGGTPSAGLTPGPSAPSTQAPAPTTPDTTPAPSSPDTSGPQPSGTLGG